MKIENQNISSKADLNITTTQGGGFNDYNKSLDLIHKTINFCFLLRKISAR